MFNQPHLGAHTRFYASYEEHNKRGHLSGHWHGDCCHASHELLPLPGSVEPMVFVLMMVLVCVCVSSRSLEVKQKEHEELNVTGFKQEVSFLLDGAMPPSNTPTSHLHPSSRLLEMCFPLSHHF